MARRRASKSSKPRSINKKDSSIKRWNTREDIPFDEVDEFHEQRDKILLEGEAEAQDSDYDDDEVFALKGLDESSEESETEDFGEDEEAEEPERPSMTQKKEKLKKKRIKEKTNTGSKTEKKPTESSDEHFDGEEEEEESWGLKKSTYYSSNAAQIESDDEDARQMEEEEARRLQAKLRAPMREEDFGYSEALQRAREVELNPVDDFWQTNPAPVSGEKDKVSILRDLQKTEPETLALAFEWEDIARSVIKTDRKLSQIPDDIENKVLGLVHLHYQTLLTYASLLAFYLRLRASEKYACRPGSLRQHPILSRLLTLKQSLITFEALNFSLSDSEDDLDSEDEFDSDESDNLDLNDSDDMGFGGLETRTATKKLGLEPGELEELLAQAYIPPPNGIKKKLPRVKLRVNASTTDKNRVEEPPKKKQKTLKGPVDLKSKRKLESKARVTFDVEEPTLSKHSSVPRPAAEDSHISSSAPFGYGEPTSLSSTDLTDKSVRRKALRFHTAKIESASARRKGARGALGGDDDVPYRKREKEKLKRKENQRERLGGGGEDLDEIEEGAEKEGAPRKRRREEDGSHSDGDPGNEDEEDGYYSLVKRQKKAKKAEKKAQYEAAKASTIPDPENHTLLESTQRAPTRAILANKGLTPKRSSKSSKASRNPRVKKRQKFEKAKKKLASQKATYKGPGDPGKYGGETSGISKVVKSVRL